MHPAETLRSGVGLRTLGRPLTAFQPERGEQVLVQLEPHRVAGVDVGAGDPGPLPVLDPGHGHVEPVGVAVETGQDPGEPIDQRPERTTKPDQSV